MAVVVVGWWRMNNYWAGVCTRIIILMPIALTLFILFVIGFGAKGIDNERIKCQKFGGIFVSGVCLKNNGIGK